MPCTGPDVPGAFAYRCLAVKHMSNFLRCGIETDTSLISSWTGSLATEAKPFDEAPARPFDEPDGTPTGSGPSSFLRFSAGSDWSVASERNAAILLKRTTRPGVSTEHGQDRAAAESLLGVPLPAFCLISASRSGRLPKTASSLNRSSW